MVWPDWMCEVDVLQRHSFRPFWIGEADVVEVDGAVLNFHDGVLAGLVRSDCFVQDLGHALWRMAIDMRDHNKDHREHHQAHEDVHAVAQHDSSGLPCVKVVAPELTMSCAPIQEIIRMQLYTVSCMSGVLQARIVSARISSAADVLAGFLELLALDTSHAHRP